MNIYHSLYRCSCSSVQLDWLDASCFSILASSIFALFFMHWLSGSSIVWHFLSFAHVISFDSCRHLALWLSVGICAISNSIIGLPKRIVILTTEYCWGALIGSQVDLVHIDVVIWLLFEVASLSSSVLNSLPTSLIGLVTCHLRSTWHVPLFVFVLLIAN